MSSPDPLDCIDLPISLPVASSQLSPREIKRRRIESPSKSSDLPPGSPPSQHYEAVYEPPAPAGVGLVERNQDDTTHTSHEDVSARPEVTGDDGTATVELAPKADDGEEVDDDATEPEDYSVDVTEVTRSEPAAATEDVHMKDSVAAQDSTVLRAPSSPTAEGDQGDGRAETVAPAGDIEGRSTEPAGHVSDVPVGSGSRLESDIPAEDVLMEEQESPSAVIDTSIAQSATQATGEEANLGLPSGGMTREDDLVPDATAALGDTAREEQVVTDAKSFPTDQAPSAEAELGKKADTTPLAEAVIDQAMHPAPPSRPASPPDPSPSNAIVEGEEELDPETFAEPDVSTGINASAQPSGASTPAQSAPSSKPKKGTKPKTKSKVAEVKARERAGSSLAPSEVTSSEKEGDELLCLCRKKFDEEDEEGIMVACDGGCEGWYHPGCIGMSEDDLQRLDKYICDKCAKDTTQRTVYHQRCARSECVKPVGARSSKYCSSSCAFNHMAGFIPQTPSSKLLKQLSAAFIGLPRPSSRIKVTHHEVAEPVVREDQVQKQLEVVEQSLATLRRRQEILAQLIEGAESLPPLEVKSTAAAKKKGGARSTGEDRPCGWSARLLWADDEVERWDEAQADPADACMAPRRRCDRHAGWLKSVPLSMTVEEQQLLRRKDVLEGRLGQEKRSREDQIATEQARADMLRRLEAGVPKKSAESVKAS